MYKFSRISQRGPDSGCFFHELLLRGRPDLAANIRRSRPRTSNRDVRSYSRPLLVRFDDLPPCQELSPSEIKELCQRAHLIHSSIVDGNEDNMADATVQVTAGVDRAARKVMPSQSSTMERHSSKMQDPAVRYLQISDSFSQENFLVKYTSDLNPFRVFPFEGRSVAAAGVFDEETGKYYIQEDHVGMPCFSGL